MPLAEEKLQSNKEKRYTKQTSYGQKEVMANLPLSYSEADTDNLYSTADCKNTLILLNTY